MAATVMKESLKGNIIDPKASNAKFVITVEDLINKAMGPPDQNIIHFKLLQKILYILSYHLRILKKKVYIGPDYIDTTSGSSFESESKFYICDETTCKIKQRGKEPEKGENAEPKGVKATKKILQSKIESGSHIEICDDTVCKFLQTGKQHDKGKKSEQKTAGKTDKDSKLRPKTAKTRKAMGARVEELATIDQEPDRLPSTGDSDKTETKERPKTAKRGKKMGKSERELERKHHEQDTYPSTDESDETEIFEKETGITKTKIEKHTKKPDKEEIHTKKFDRIETEIDTVKRDKVGAKKERRVLSEENELRESHAKGKSKSLTVKKSGSLTNSSISITEAEFDKENILVVERGPSSTSATGSRQRMGSIQVVTRSEFEILEGVVNDLTEKVATIQMPKMPEDKQLVNDILKGKASAVEVIGVMQVAARVQAAEQAIENVAGVLTKMAGQGAIPADVAEQLEDATAEITTTYQEFMAKSTAMLQKSGVLDVKDPEYLRSKSAYSRTIQRPYSTIQAPHSTIQRPYSTITRPYSTIERPFSTIQKPYSAIERPYSTIQTPYSTMSAFGPPSEEAMVADGYFITQDNFNEGIQSLRTGLIRFVTVQFQNVSLACQDAAEAVKTIQNQMAIALTLNRRLDQLKSLVKDYSTQFKGLDSGLASQIAYLSKQIDILRVELKAGLQQMEKANNSTEAMIIQEWRESYENLVETLKHIDEAQKKTYNYTHEELREDVRGLAEFVEMLQALKMDREELIDGLRNKANLSSLKGLVSEETFQKEQTDVRRLLDTCYRKFERQEEVWLYAIRDLAQTTSEKAEMSTLVNAQLQANRQITELQTLVAKLSKEDPQAAILTRKVSMNGVCGPCGTVAVQNAEDEGKHAPPRLPAMRPPPVGEEQPQPCTSKEDGKGFLPKLMQEESVPKSHVCKRWVGGSHTLLNEAVRRTTATQPADSGPPLRRYTDFGTDGKGYQVEEELLPCLECHVARPDSSELPKSKSPKLNESKPSIDETHKLSMDKLSGPKVVPSVVIMPTDIRRDEIENQSQMTVQSITFHDEEGAIDVEGKIE